MRENIEVKYSYISSSAGLDSFSGFFSLVPIRFVLLFRAFVHAVSERPIGIIRGLNRLNNYQIRILKKANLPAVKNPDK